MEPDRAWRHLSIHTTAFEAFDELVRILPEGAPGPDGPMRGEAFDFDILAVGKAGDKDASVTFTGFIDEADSHPYDHPTFYRRWERLVRDIRGV